MKRWRFFLVVVGLVVTTTQIDGQQEQKNVDTGQESRSGHLQLRQARQTRSPADNLEFVATIANNGTRGIRVTRVVLRAPSDFKTTKRTDGDQAQDSAVGGVLIIKDFGENGLQLSPGVTEMVHFSLSGVGVWDFPAEENMLFFRAATYEFFAAAEILEGAGQNEIKYTAYAVTTVDFDPPFLSLLAGSCGGSLLIAFVGFFSRVLTLHLERKSVELWHNVKTLLITVPLGILLAIIAIVAAMCTSGFQQVLSIDLVDFRAGLLIGMMAQLPAGPLAQFLDRNLGVRLNSVQPNSDGLASGNKANETRRENA